MKKFRQDQINSNSKTIVGSETEPPTPPSPPGPRVLAGTPVPCTVVWRRSVSVHLVQAVTAVEKPS